MNLDIDSIAHTKYNCKYHVVFAPKYRRQVIYGIIKADQMTLNEYIDPFTGEPVKNSRR